MSAVLSADREVDQKTGTIRISATAVPCGRRRPCSQFWSVSTLMPAARGQGRGNSGCYLPNGDEVQVLDSFGMDTYKGGGCGGLYNYKDPDVFDVFSLVSLPPLEWQTYDIEYRVEKKDGKPAGKPKITVVHNGIKIHDQAELKNDAKKGGLHFQDHGNPVRYRNIWLRELK